MEKVVPQKTLFDIAEKLDCWHGRLAYTTALVSFATGILDGCTPAHPLLQKLVDDMPAVVLVLAVFTVILHGLFISRYQEAEAIRRDDFFDNAFGCLLGDNQSSGYFSNDAVSVGMKKALLNISENCFHSLDVIRYMHKCKIRSTVPLCILLLAVIAFNIGGHSFTMLALNLFLALDIVTDIFRLYRLKQNLEKVHSNCKSILALQSLNERIEDQPQVVGKIIREIVRYETALSYASIMFNSKYFKQTDSKKSKEWEDYKKRYLQ